MEKHIYEIYTKNPTTGENGWDIKFVISTPSLIEKFHLFDSIISVDNYDGSSEVHNFLP